MPGHVWDAYFLPFAVFTVPTLFIFALALGYVVRRHGRRTRPSRLPTVRGPVERLLWWWR